MPTVQRFPDAEALAALILKSANVCGGRIYSSRPKTVVLPLVVVQRVGGVPENGRSIDTPRIQCDVWGSNKSEARREAEAARVALHAAAGSIISLSLLGYVCGVVDETGLTWLPDPVTKEDRYTFSVLMTTRAWKHRWSGMTT